MKRTTYRTIHARAHINGTSPIRPARPAPTVAYNAMPLALLECYCHGCGRDFSRKYAIVTRPARRLFRKTYQCPHCQSADVRTGPNRTRPGR